MIHADIVPESKNCYRPARVVTSLIADVLQFDRRVEEFRRATSAGEITQEEEVDRTEELRLEKRNLQKRKVHALNSFIFPSMANLTVFLEGISKSGFASNLFDDDLKALFLAKSTVGNTKKTIFARFTDASCKMIIDKQEKDGKMANVILDKFRLILCDIMQESVYRALLEVAPFEYMDLDFLHKTLYADMDRLHAWTTMLAKKEVDSDDAVFDEDRRPALF